MLKNLDLGPVSQKPWTSLGPAKPFLVIYILKTEIKVYMTETLYEGNHGIKQLSNQNV